MKTYSLYLTALLALLLCGCNNEIPFNLQENPPKLVINALIHAENPENYLYLSLTGQTKPTYVTDATVEVRINGQLAETVHAQPVSGNSFPNQYRLTSRFNPGDLVRIDAITADGKHHAWAEDVVPQPIDIIERVDTVTKQIARYNAFVKMMQYKITFKDRPNEKNYYRLVLETRTVEQRITESGKDTTAITLSHNLLNREDVVLTDGRPMTSEEADNGLFDVIENRYNVFDDSRFTNNTYTMTVYNQKPLDYSWNWNKVVHAKADVTIRIVSITEAEYYYLKVLNALDSDAFDESVNEPIRFPSNVNGGIGIVGFSTERSYLQPIGEADIPLPDENLYP